MAYKTPEPDGADNQAKKDSGVVDALQKLYKEKQEHEPTLILDEKGSSHAGGEDDSGFSLEDKMNFIVFYLTRYLTWDKMVVNAGAMAHALPGANGADTKTIEEMVRETMENASDETRKKITRKLKSFEELDGITEEYRHGKIAEDKEVHDAQITCYGREKDIKKTQEALIRKIIDYHQNDYFSISISYTSDHADGLILMRAMNCLLAGNYDGMESEVTNNLINYYEERKKQVPPSLQEIIGEMRALKRMKRRLAWEQKQSTMQQIQTISLDDENNKSQEEHDNVPAHPDEGKVIEEGGRKYRIGEFGRKFLVDG
jgi:hypothetical protein